jgi:hypothetical protein
VSQAYTDSVKNETGNPALLGLGGAPGRSFHLGSVYVPLVTIAPDSHEATGSADTEEKRESTQLLLHALGARSLYVSAAPGAGKSMFCRWVAWLVANGAMPPADIEPPSPLRESLPPSLCERLVVLVPLRELCDALPKRVGRDMTADDLATTITRWLHARSTSARDVDLPGFLEAGRALILFDGVDEVPTADAGGSGRRNPRQLLLNGLSRAVESWVPKGNRLLLTRRWFRIEKKDAAIGDAIATQLMRDVAQRPWLQPLAANPLMLTAMCAIYNDGGKLPQDRHQLYERIVDGMLTKRYADPVEAIAARGAHAPSLTRCTPARRWASITRSRCATRNTRKRSWRCETTRTRRGQSMRSSRPRCSPSSSRDRAAGRTTQTGTDVLSPSIQEFLAAQRILESHSSSWPRCSPDARPFPAGGTRCRSCSRAMPTCSPCRRCRSRCFEI